ncbi:MAG TPA: hypothetical protein VHO24_02635 [Opitutaceae bacterium]|nr:hypothetical protein [Opitutaceae bacterium]
MPETQPAQRTGAMGPASPARPMPRQDNLVGYPVEGHVREIPCPPEHSVI